MGGGDPILEVVACYEAGNESAGGIDGTEAAGGGEPTAAAATAADRSAGGLIAVMKVSLDRDRGGSEAGRPALSPPTLRPWSPRARAGSPATRNAPKFAPFCDSDHRQSSRFKLSTCAGASPRRTRSERPVSHDRVDGVTAEDAGRDVGNIQIPVTDALELRRPPARLEGASASVAGGRCRPSGRRTDVRGWTGATPCVFSTHH